MVLLNFVGSLYSRPFVFMVISYAEGFKKVWVNDPSWKNFGTLFKPWTSILQPAACYSYAANQFCSRVSLLKRFLLLSIDGLILCTKLQIMLDTLIAKILLFSAQKFTSWQTCSQQFRSFLSGWLSQSIMPMNSSSLNGTLPLTYTMD